MQYQIGMYGGSFNPLHCGHVNCILHAATLCQQLYLVLSVGLNRDEIDYRVRYRWLYQITRHMGNVKIIVLEDHAHTKQEYTEAYWAADAAFIKKTIGRKIDVIFCGSDYDIHSFWNVCYPESELFIFKRDHISSTEIRKNPYAHWAWIPHGVRAYYTKKVLLIGGESTGKSTLTIHLANRFNTNYIDEAGRDISEKSGTDQMMLSEDFTEILLQHKLNEMKAIEWSNQVLFVDTDTLVTQFYMNFLHDPNLDKNKALSDAIDSLNTYDLILFMEPDVAFVQDGGRSSTIKNDRIRYSEQIKDLLLAHNRAFVCIRGDYHERYVRAVKEVSKLLQEDALVD